MTTFTKEDYKDLAMALPQNVSYVNKIVRKDFPSFTFILSLTMVVPKTGRPIPVWWDAVVEDSGVEVEDCYKYVDFDIDELIDAYENLVH